MTAVASLTYVLVMVDHKPPIKVKDRALIFFDQCL